MIIEPVIFISKGRNNSARPFFCVCPAGHTYLEAKVLYRPERFLSISKDKWGGYQDVQLKGAKWFKKPVGT